MNTNGNNDWVLWHSRNIPALLKGPRHSVLDENVAIRVSLFPKRLYHMSFNSERRNFRLQRLLFTSSQFGNIKTAENLWGSYSTLISFEEIIVRIRAFCWSELEESSTTLRIHYRCSHLRPVRSTVGFVLNVATLYVEYRAYVFLFLLVVLLCISPLINNLSSWDGANLTCCFAGDLTKDDHVPNRTQKQKAGVSDAAKTCHCKC